MHVSIDAALETGAVCEAAICYTGDILDKSRPKYSLKYYVAMAKELEKLGTHFLAIKDMAGLCKPYAAFELVKTLRQEVGIPIHFHTHDTSGINAASVLKAAEAGVDVADVAIAAMSGGTSQPNLNSIVEALRHTPRDTQLDVDTLNECSDYWKPFALTIFRSTPVPRPARRVCISMKFPAVSTPTCVSRLPPWASVIAGAMPKKCTRR